MLNPFDFARTSEFHYAYDGTLIFASVTAFALVLP